MLNRRQFIVSSLAAGAWLMNIQVPLARAAEKKAADAKSSQWSIYLAILPDNTIKMESPVMEMGQFMRTTGPMLLAEELDLDWDSIEFTHDTLMHITRDDKGAVNYSHASQFTGGSFAARMVWDYLRTSGATVRQMLVEEAAERWNIAPEKLRTEKNYVIDPAGSRRFSYGELAEKASRRQVDTGKLKLKDAKNYTIIGRDRRNIDLDAIVTGKPVFGIDADYPNAVQVIIHRAPALGAEIASYDKKAALKVPGVIDVVEMQREDDEHHFSGHTQMLAAGVAVVAENLWAAMQGKAKLNTQWKHTSKFVDQNSAQQIAQFHKMVGDDSAPANTTQDLGSVKDALSEADFVVDASYEKPLFAHALMEPFNCIADIRKDSATVITGHQSPVRIAEDVEKYTGVSALNTEVICKRMGGGFGRRWVKDYPREAIILSHKLKRPVKITWMREDEMERDFPDPASVTRIRAGVKDGKIIAWHHRQAQTKGGAQDTCFPHGLVENYRVDLCEFESHIPGGAWRGPQHPIWAFAVECTIDEIAHKLGRDPLQYRLDMLYPERDLSYANFGADKKNTGRMARCYEAAAKAAQWNKPRPNGTGLGIAGHFCHGSYAAFVVEVSVSEKNELKINEAWGAIDCGRAINPNHIRAQMEGGFIDGLGAALFNKLDYENGQVINNQFNQFRLIKMKEAPLKVHSIILDNDHSPTGVGEPPTAPAPAALANAIFAACGKRIRKMPIAEEFVI